MEELESPSYGSRMMGETDLHDLQQQSELKADRRFLEDSSIDRRSSCETNLRHRRLRSVVRWDQLPLLHCSCRVSASRFVRYPDSLPESLPTVHFLVPTVNLHDDCPSVG